MLSHTQLQLCKEMEMLTNLIVVIIVRYIYMYLVIALYTLNLHVLSQEYRNKAGKDFLKG